MTQDQASVIAAFLDSFPNTWQGAVASVREMGFNDQEIVDAINVVNRIAGVDELDIEDL